MKTVRRTDALLKRDPDSACYRKAETPLFITLHSSCHSIYKLPCQSALVKPIYGWPPQHDPLFVTTASARGCRKQVVTVMVARARRDATPLLCAIGRIRRARRRDASIVLGVSVHVPIMCPCQLGDPGSHLICGSLAHASLPFPGNISIGSAVFQSRDQHTQQTDDATASVAIARIQQSALRTAMRPKIKRRTTEITRRRCSVSVYLAPPD